MSEDWQITCGICGTRGTEGGNIGKVDACVKCYNKFEAEAEQARVVAKANEQLAKVNDGLRNQNVAQDLAIENDTRVVELRAEVARLKERITMLEKQVARLNEYARG